jgi:uncharacterized protein YceK
MKSIKTIQKLKSDDQFLAILKAGALLLALIAMLMLGSGCGSLGARLDHAINGQGELGAYPGVREGVKFVVTSPVQAVKHPVIIPFVPLVIADIPLSFVVDTALLPCDLKDK